MRILSVDMDFFSDMLEGDTPECGSWEIEFSRRQPVNSLFFEEDCNKVYKKLSSIPKLYMAIDHHSIVKLCSLPCEIINLDHHPDSWDYGSLTCANWVYHLKESNLLNRYHWVMRSHDHFAPLKGVEFCTLEEALSFEYDIAFVCLSPDWFPPNLQDYFEKIMELPHSWLDGAYHPNTYDLKNISPADSSNYIEKAGDVFKYTYADDEESFTIPVSVNELVFDHKAESYIDHPPMKMNKF